MNRARKSAGRAAQPWGFAAAAAILLLALPALETIQCRLLEQHDIWVALRCGLWILEQRAVPRNALFTQLPHLSWTDTSWALDVLRGAAYRLGGLPGLEMLQILLLAALAACVLLLCLTLAQRRWLALLPAAAAVALLGLGNATVSPALFALELAIILHALHGGGMTIRVLPLLFVLWANVDATFLIGLALLLWLPGALVLERATLPSSGRPLTPGAGALTFAASALACMISPYGWRVYQPLRWAMEGHAYRYTAALHAQSFRHDSDFFVMELLLLGFFALGRTRSHSLFAWGTVFATAMLSCAMQELRWSGIVAATAALALGLRPSSSPPNQLRPMKRREVGLTAAGAVLALLALAFHLGTQGEKMARQVAAHFPAAACQFIRHNALPQPLFHEYGFGSYLTFALPEYPVVIDGRAEIYGDEGNLEFMAAMNGRIAVDKLDSFGRARTLLLRPDSQLAAVIGSRADFTEVYRDDQAIVLLRRAEP